jgi:hypothetical protein
MLNNSNGITKFRIVRKSALLLFVVLGLLLISYVEVAVQSSAYAKRTYTNDQEQPVRALDVKMHIEKKIVLQGNTQAMDFQINDQKTQQPIAGSIISAAVTYSDGQTIRQLNALSDESGHCNISWRIERNAPVGNYRVSYSVSQTGYVSGGLAPELYFTVVPSSMSIQQSTNTLSLWHIN